jgi:hypothetical protein
MPTVSPAARRPARDAVPALLLALLLALGACSTAEVPPSGSGIASASGGSGDATPSLTAAPAPTPTALPTPRYTNEPDAALSALIPSRVAGARVVSPPPAEYGVTPGDFGSVFGDLGLRLASLALAYIEKPRLSLYAARVGAPPATTAGLRPYLAAAAQYVGINGLHPEAWKAAAVDGKQVWTRGEDGATLAGTTLYCWTSGEYLFLVIGSSDATNRAMVTALPGEPAPTPTPRPTASPSATGSAAGSAAPSAGASPSG